MTHSTSNDEGRRIVRNRETSLFFCVLPARCNGADCIIVALSPLVFELSVAFLFALDFLLVFVSNALTALFLPLHLVSSLFSSEVTSEISTVKLIFRYFVSKEVLFLPSNRVVASRRFSLVIASHFSLSLSLSLSLFLSLSLSLSVFRWSERRTVDRDNL